MMIGLSLWIPSHVLDSIFLLLHNICVHTDQIWASGTFSQCFEVRGLGLSCSEDCTEVGCDATLTNPDQMSANTIVDLSLGLL